MPNVRSLSAILGDVLKKGRCPEVFVDYSCGHSQQTDIQVPSFLQEKREPRTAARAIRRTAAIPRGDAGAFCIDVPGGVCPSCGSGSRSSLWCGGVMMDLASVGQVAREDSVLPVGVGAAQFAEWLETPHGGASSGTGTGTPAQKIQLTPAVPNSGLAWWKSSLTTPGSVLPVVLGLVVWALGCVAYALFVAPELNMVSPELFFQQVQQQIRLIPLPYDSPNYAHYRRYYLEQYQQYLRTYREHEAAWVKDGRSWFNWAAFLQGIGFGTLPLVIALAFCEHRYGTLSVWIEAAEELWFSFLAWTRAPPRDPLADEKKQARFLQEVLKEPATKAITTQKDPGLRLEVETKTTGVRSSRQQKNKRRARGLSCTRSEEDTQATEYPDVERDIEVEDDDLDEEQETQVKAHENVEARPNVSRLLNSLSWISRPWSGGSHENAAAADGAAHGKDDGLDAETGASETNAHGKAGQPHADMQLKSAAEEETVTVKTEDEYEDEIEDDDDDEDEVEEDAEDEDDEEEEKENDQDDEIEADTTEDQQHSNEGVNAEEDDNDGQSWQLCTSRRGLSSRALANGYVAHASRPKDGSARAVVKFVEVPFDADRTSSSSRAVVRPQCISVDGGAVGKKPASLRWDPCKLVCDQVRSGILASTDIGESSKDTSSAGSEDISCKGGLEANCADGSGPESTGRVANSYISGRINVPSLIDVRQRLFLELPKVAELKSACPSPPPGLLGQFASGDSLLDEEPRPLKELPDDLDSLSTDSLVELLLDEGIREELADKGIRVRKYLLRCLRLLQTDSSPPGLTQPSASSTLRLEAPEFTPELVSHEWNVDAGEKHVINPDFVTHSFMIEGATPFESPLFDPIGLHNFEPSLAGGMSNCMEMQRRHMDAAAMAKWHAAMAASTVDGVDPGDGHKTKLRSTSTGKTGRTRRRAGRRRAGRGKAAVKTDDSVVELDDGSWPTPEEAQHPVV